MFSKSSQSGRKEQTMIISVFSALAFIFLNPGEGIAKLNTEGDPYSVNDAALDGPEVSCDRFCDSISSIWKGWTRSDDQWCANHGSQTEISVPPQQNLSSSSLPQAQSCPYPMLAGDRSCEQVRQKLWACKFKNTNVATQCMAYKGFDESAQWSKNVLYLQTLAASTCATACAAEVLTLGIGGPALEKACRYSGRAATGGEIAAILMLDGEGDSAFAQATRGFFAGTGVLATKVSTKITKEAVKQYAKPACIAAVSYAALAGLRHKFLNKNSDLKKNACNRVKELAGNAIVPDSGVGGSGYTGGGGFGGNGFSSGFGSVAGGGHSGIGSGGGTSAHDFFNLDQNSLRASADTRLLSESGIFDALKQNASKIPHEDLMRDLDEGNLSSAYGRIISDQGLANQMAGLTSAASEEAHRLASLLPDGGQMMMASATPGSSYSGKGAGSGGSTDSGTSFKLFPGSSSNQKRGIASQGAPKTQTQFRGDVDPNDIWHSGTNKSLFEIVSGRIEQVSPRLSGEGRSQPSEGLSSGL